MAKRKRKIFILSGYVWLEFPVSLPPAAKLVAAPKYVEEKKASIAGATIPKKFHRAAIVDYSHFEDKLSGIIGVSGGQKSLSAYELAFWPLW